MANSQEPWVILDARAVMHHCFNMGKDPEGILGEDNELYNSAEYAFRNFLNRYMDAVFKLVAPRQVLIAMDAGIEYRRGIHPDYKKKREEKKTVRDPVQIEQSAKFYRSMQNFWAATGCTVARVPGVEADDLIAFFCERLPGKKMVYTTDGDLTALITPEHNTMIQLKLEPMMADHYVFSGGPAKGLPVGEINLVTVGKSMLGDVSDQYGGIRGFGPAKWEELVADFGYDGIQELENCVKTRDYSALKEALEACPNSKPLQLLAGDTDNWELQYELAMLQPKLCEGTIKRKIIKIEWFRRVPDLARLTKVLTDMNCIGDYLERYEDLCVQMWLLDSANIESGDLDEALEAFAESPSVAFDYETQDAHYETFAKASRGGNFVDIMTSKLAGASFCFGNNHQYCFYLPVHHKDSHNLEPKVIKQLLEKFPYNDTKLVAHNNAFEGGVTALNLNLELPEVHDTSIMASYVDENMSAGLKSLSKEELNYTQTTYADVVGDKLGMFEVTAEETLKYGCDDSIVTAHLYDFYRLRMMLEGSWDFYAENEPFAQKPLTEAYLNGAEIDWERLSEIEAVDLETIKVKTAYLREQLEEHCLTGNEAGALAYIAADAMNIQTLARVSAKKAADKQVDSGKLEAEDVLTWVENKVTEDLDKFRAKARAGSIYEPHSEEIVMPEFKPTVTAFNKVIEALGITVPLESVAKSRISEWAASVEDYDFDDKEATENKVLNKDQQAFLEALVEAAPALKKREGDFYENLVKLCAPHLGEGKVVASGTQLNLGSPQQVQHLLYCMLGLPVRLRAMPQVGSGRQKHNLEGSPGTDDLTIATALAEDVPETDWRHPILLAIKDVKEASTRCSLYHNTYPLWKHPDDGRMHPQIRNCGTVTRRPSGTSPNILQVSKHQIDGAMRGVYIPHKERFDFNTGKFVSYEEPRVVIAIDFSQQELRILASESGDEVMQSAYIGADRKDIHSLTGSGIAKMDYPKYAKILADEDNPQHKEMHAIRKKPAKQTNFLIAYMGTAFTLSTKLIIPYDAADEMMESTFSLYPGIRAWQEEMGKFSRVHGYAQTAYGNRRHLNGRIFASEDKVRRRMERQAANSVIQGTAADILKIVLAQADKTRLFKETNSILLAPVYDEITASVPVSQAVEYVNRLTAIMELTPPGHAVPMEADVSIGPDWQMLKEIGVRPSADAIVNACEIAIKKQEEKAMAKAA